MSLIGFRDYDSIKNEYLDELKTVEKQLIAYGGPVTIVSPYMDKSGKLTLAFNRPIVFPTKLLTPYDPSYIEVIIEPTLTKEEND